MINKKTCKKCGWDEIEVCENCGRQGCTECEQGWQMDSEGVWLCPECAAAFREEWNRETDNGTKICGTCAHFDNEADEDYGVCARDKGDYPAGHHCECWAAETDTKTT